MVIVLKIFLVLFIIGWSALGLYLLIHFDRFFGRHRDDPSETAGASSLNITHIASVWFGFFALAVYFLFA
ncbi:MAG: hypothetical protein QM627_09395 [Luteolibacter sp.]